MARIFKAFWVGRFYIFCKEMCVNDISYD